MNSSCDTEATTKPTNKRLRHPEEEIVLPDEYAPPAKRAKTTASDISQPLTAGSLERHTLHEGHVDTFELMDSEAGRGPGSKRSKRSASQVGISISGDLETVSQATQKSSFSASHYRHSFLKDVNIRFQFRRAPEDIRTQITTIVQAEVPPERTEELSLIAQKLQDDFADVLDIAAREDDCVELFYQALSSMGYNESLAFRRKADWRPSLKPGIPPKKANLDYLYRSEDEAKESRGQPSNRQQGGHVYISPDTSGAAVTDERMGPPSTPQSDVKTPRPDISIGLKDAALNKSLQSRGLTVADTEYLLGTLAKPHSQTGRLPLLYSEPTQAALQIRFPCFLVEGKSYATCRTIYEAQNQAAVSGACSLKILHDLDDLVRKSNPGSYSKVQPIVFSVCTEGPIHQLWAHYTTVGDGDGDRMYYMAQVKTCDVGICDNILVFLEAIDNVLKWGSGKHKDAIAEQLSTLWQHSS